jgi:hypothetical protein
MKSLINLVKKNISFLMVCTVFGTLSLVSLNVYAQEVVPNPGDIIEDVKNAKSWADLIGIEAAIYTFIITVFGWFSAYFPGLNKINSGTLRVLVWAILVIAGSLVIGIGDVWVGAISYLFSTSLYEVVLKWFIRSPKPSELK